MTSVAYKCFNFLLWKISHRYKVEKIQTNLLVPMTQIHGDHGQPSSQVPSPFPFCAPTTLYQGKSRKTSTHFFYQLFPHVWDPLSCLWSLFLLATPHQPLVYGELWRVPVGGQEDGSLSPASAHRLPLSQSCSPGGMTLGGALFSGRGGAPSGSPRRLLLMSPHSLPS